MKQNKSIVRMRLNLTVGALTDDLSEFIESNKGLKDLDLESKEGIIGAKCCFV
jgi:hypothetical protein